MHSKRWWNSRKSYKFVLVISEFTERMQTLLNARNKYAYNVLSGQ